MQRNRSRPVLGVRGVLGEGAGHGELRSAQLASSQHRATFVVPLRSSSNAHGTNRVGLLRVAPDEVRVTACAQRAVEVSIQCFSDCIRIVTRISFKQPLAR